MEVFHVLSLALFLRFQINFVKSVLLELLHELLIKLDIYQPHELILVLVDKGWMTECFSSFACLEHGGCPYNGLCARYMNGQGFH